MQNNIPYIFPQQANRPSSRIVPVFEHIFLKVEAFYYSVISSEFAFQLTFPPFPVAFSR